RSGRLWCPAMASPVAERAPAGAIDLLDGDLYAGDPDPTYAWLRRHAPLYRDEINRLWGVSRYFDIVAIEKDPATFCSSEGYRPPPRLDGRERRPRATRTEGGCGPAASRPRQSPATRTPCATSCAGSSTPWPARDGARSSRSWRRRCRRWSSAGCSGSTTS